jgi:hypothetical protein
MPSPRNLKPDLKKLAQAVARIRRATPARSKSYNVMVENPFESGYWPPSKPTKRDLAAAKRLRLAHAATR